VWEGSLTFSLQESSLLPKRLQDIEEEKKTLKEKKEKKKARGKSKCYFQPSSLSLSPFPPLFSPFQTITKLTFIIISRSQTPH
jgi:hypothetical protein